MRVDHRLRERDLNLSCDSCNEKGAIHTIVITATLYDTELMPKINLCTKCLAELGDEIENIR